MTEIEALNMLLRLVGASPVNDLESKQPDVPNAKATLNRLRKQLQQRGWWFNMDYGVQLVRDVTGFIEVPTSYLSIIPPAQSYFVERGNRLYNLETNSYIFTEDVQVDRAVRELQWDEQPSIMQTYVAYAAGAQFIRDELEDAVKQRDLEKSAAQALIAVQKQDLEEGRYNMFSQARVRRARLGVQPYKRY